MNIGFGTSRKTILLVDDDAHARAALRKSLEAAGFSVGEAANAHEGERTTFRVKPDAILAELITERADSSAILSERLKAAGSTIPFYIVSGAGDALFCSVALHDLGITGVFLKPIDPAIVIQTLQTRLAGSDGTIRQSNGHA